MATSKILYMKDCGKAYHGKHLREAIRYISDGSKTQQGRWIGGLNCQPMYAYEKMIETKERFGKTDKRQGYHLIISFQEGEVDGDTAFEILERFAREYFDSNYEAVYAVHDNTAHVHGHIVFNSVGCLDGKKYRYNKGDWAREIQPVTNKLCREYGISTIEIEDEKARPNEGYKEWDSYRDGPFVWSEMIQKDVDFCIMQSSDFAEFLLQLKRKGYEVQQGKYLAVRPRGMKRFRRLKTLGAEYTEERIRERILSEWLTEQQPELLEEAERKVYESIPYGKRKAVGIQKPYYTKLYRIGMIRKRPYSKVWKYRDEIRKLKKVQEQYLFLVTRGITSKEELLEEAQQLTDKKKEISSERRRLYRERKKNEPLFRLQEEMKQYEAGEAAYQTGDKFFIEEHEMWKSLEKKLEDRGYDLEKVEEMREEFREELARVRMEEKEAAKQLKIAQSILNELVEEKRSREEKEKVREKQPKR